MLLYYSPIFLENETGNHPENAARIVPAVRHLNQVSMHFGCGRPSWEEVSPKRLERVHSRKYISSVRSLAEHGGGLIDEETMVSSHSYRMARMAAGAVCDAVEQVITGQERRAFCLVRPPGHHALPDAAMGFCLINNVAVGVRMATDEMGIGRVLIVDWDAHHGNGTQAIFWEDSQVGYFSIHRSGIFPDTGAADETGAGRGLGTTFNVPVEFGTSRHEYLKTFAEAVQRVGEAIKPQLVLISAGFDAHRADAVGSLGLESEDFGTLTRMVMKVAAVHAKGRVVSVLEGGYNPTAVAESVEQHVLEMLTA